MPKHLAAVFLLLSSVNAANADTLNCRDAKTNENFQLKVDLSKETAEIDGNAIQFAGQTDNSFFVWNLKSELNILIAISVNKNNGQYWVSFLPPRENSSISSGQCFQPLGTIKE